MHHSFSGHQLRTVLSVKASLAVTLLVSAFLFVLTTSRHNASQVNYLFIYFKTECEMHEN